MIDILLLTILVAIILGVSLHDAFWAIVAFVIGLTIFIIVASVFGLGWSLIAIKIQNAKKNRVQIREKIKAEAKDGLVEGLVILWMFSPLLFVPLLSYLAANNEFLQQNGWIVLVVGLLPFVGGIIAFLYKVKTIKKTRR